MPMSIASLFAGLQWAAVESGHQSAQPNYVQDYIPTGICLVLSALLTLLAVGRKERIVNAENGWSIRLYVIIFIVMSGYVHPDLAMQWGCLAVSHSLWVRY